MKKSSKKNMIKKVRKVRSVQNAKTTWNKEEILNLISVFILNKVYEMKKIKVYYEDFIKTKKKPQISTRLQKFERRIELIYDFFLEYFEIYHASKFPRISLTDDFYCIRDNISSEFLLKFKETKEFKNFNYEFLNVLEVQNIFKPINQNILQEIGNDGLLFNKQCENKHIVLNIENNFYNFLKSLAKDNIITIDSNTYLKYLSTKNSKMT